MDKLLRVYKTCKENNIFVNIHDNLVTSDSLEKLNRKKLTEYIGMIYSNTSLSEVIEGLSEDGSSMITYSIIGFYKNGMELRNFIHNLFLRYNLKAFTKKDETNGLEFKIDLLISDYEFPSLVKSIRIEDVYQTEGEDSDEEKEQEQEQEQEHEEEEEEEEEEEDEDEQQEDGEDEDEQQEDGKEDEDDDDEDDDEKDNGEYIEQEQEKEEEDDFKVKEEDEIILKRQQQEEEERLKHEKRQKKKELRRLEKQQRKEEKREMEKLILEKDRIIF